MKELEKFNALKSEITDLVAPVLQVTVIDADSSQKAIDAAKTLKEMEKRIETLRRAEVDPLNAKVKEINAYAKAVSAPLDQADQHLRAQLNAFANEQEKIRREAMRKAEEIRLQKEAELRHKQEEERAALDAGSELFGASDSEAETIAEKQRIEIAMHKAESEALAYDANQMNIKNMVKTYELRVVDISLVPKEFLIIQVNEKAALAAHKAGAKIAGLEFAEKIEVRIGAKTRVPKAMLS